MAVGVGVFLQSFAARCRVSIPIHGSAKIIVLISVIFFTILVLSSEVLSGLVRASGFQRFAMKTTPSAASCFQFLCERVDNLPCMPGLFIIAHAPLASALKQAAAHCFPEAAQHVQILDVPPNLPIDEVEAQARLLLGLAEASDARREVLVLSDVFGATPCNVVQRLADGVRVKVITGVNVPMVWRAMNYASEPLEAVVTRAVAGGAQGVMQIASSRPHNQAIQPTHDQDHRHHQQ